MSYFAYDPDMYETVSDRHTCAYHKLHPGAPWAGCTCSASFSQRLRPRDEYLALRDKRIRDEEDRVLAQAEAIKASRAALSKAGTD